MAVAPSISYGPIPMYGALKSAHSMQCMRLRSILATRRQTHDAGRDEMAGQIDMTKLRQAPSVDRELVSASRDLPGGRAYVDAGVQHRFGLSTVPRPAMPARTNDGRLVYLA